MNLAYWCVFIALLLPWFTVAYAKKQGGFTHADNHHPRDFMRNIQGKAARANAAQQNGFEIFAPFAAAVIIAQATGNAAQGTIDFWSVLFIISRITYTWCYITDRAFARSAVWSFGLLCIVALFIAAI